MSFNRHKLSTHRYLEDSYLRLSSLVLGIQFPTEPRQVDFLLTLEHVATKQKVNYCLSFLDAQTFQHISVRPVHLYLLLPSPTQILRQGVL
jgi:hypothetical protein